MTATDFAAERACEKLVLGFFRNLDERNYPALLNSLHPDAVWIRGGQELKGRAHAEDALNGRSATLHIHHVVTNLQVDIGSSGACDFFCYLIVFKHDDGKPLSEPAPLKGPSTIYACRGSCHQAPEGWQITYLTFGPPTFLAR